MGFDLVAIIQLLCLELNLKFNSHTSYNLFQVQQQLNLPFGPKRMT
jgi:hypothetical protein